MESRTSDKASTGSVRLVLQVEHCVGASERGSRLDGLLGSGQVCGAGLEAAYSAWEGI